MRLEPQPHVASTLKPLQSLKQGFDYAFASLPIRWILILMSVFSLTTMSYSTLMPVVSAGILHGDAHTLGLLLSSAGVGALLGGAYMSTRSSVLGLGVVVAYAPLLCGVGLIGFALSRMLWLSLPALVLVGLGSILQISGSNTILQTIVEDDKRGRVLSLFTMSFLGVAPFGNLLAGSLAHAIGVPNTFILNGIICILMSAIVIRQLPMLKQIVRPIYVKKGIFYADY
jgi:MFS family permease